MPKIVSTLLLTISLITTTLFANLTTNSSPNTQQLYISQLTGALIGQATGGDKGANTAYDISTSATKYNRQLHQKEIDWLENKNNINNFAKELYGNNPTKKQIQQAQRLLYTSAMYYNDKAKKVWIDANQREVGYPYSKEEIKKAFAFLKQNSKDKNDLHSNFDYKNINQKKEKI